MATMSSEQRAEVTAESMRDNRWTNVPNVLKSDLRAAVNAADQWVSDNAASFNSALPATYRTNATSAQKALLLVWVVTKRFLTGV